VFIARLQPAHSYVIAACCISWLPSLLAVRSQRLLWLLMTALYWRFFPPAYISWGQCRTRLMRYDGWKRCFRSQPRLFCLRVGRFQPLIVMVRSLVVLHIQLVEPIAAFYGANHVLGYCCHDRRVSKANKCFKATNEWQGQGKITQYSFCQKELLRWKRNDEIVLL